MSRTMPGWPSTIGVPPGYSTSICGGAVAKDPMRPRRCDLRRQLVDVIHDDVTFTVAERTFAPRTGFESAFQRDRRPCTAAERQATRDILASVRSELIALVSELSDPLLDWEDPERVLPSYASWRSVRQLAWHVVDTESRYYLPCTGLGYREPTESLSTSSSSRPLTWTLWCSRCQPMSYERLRPARSGHRLSSCAGSRGMSGVSLR